MFPSKKYKCKTEATMAISNGMFRVSFHHYTTHVRRPSPRSPLDAWHGLLHLTGLSPALPLLAATTSDVFRVRTSTTQPWKELHTVSEGFPPATLPGCPVRLLETETFQMPFLQVKDPAKVYRTADMLRAHISSTLRLTTPPVEHKIAGGVRVPFDATVPPKKYARCI